MIVALLLACYSAIGIVIIVRFHTHGPDRVDRHAEQAALDPVDAPEVLPEYRYLVEQWIGQAYEDIYDYRRLQRLPGETSYREEKRP